jgi:hypothetical protein
MFKPPGPALLDGLIGGNVRASDRALARATSNKA